MGKIGTKSGYHFQIHLPGTAANKTISDNGTTGHTNINNAKAIDAQEKHYRAYAWPVKWNTTGIRCFAIDQAGEVLAASNDESVLAKPYEGTTSVPEFDAAVSGTKGRDGNTFIGLFKADKVATDKQKWTSAGQ